MSLFYSISLYIGFFFFVLHTHLSSISLDLILPRRFNGLMSIGWVGSNAIELCDLLTNKYIHKHSVTHCFQQPYLSISMSRDWPDTDSTSQQLITKSRLRPNTRFLCPLHCAKQRQHLINKELLKLDSCIKLLSNLLSIVHPTVTINYISSIVQFLFHPNIFQINTHKTCVHS